jgi:large subunit ribosomal protein L15
MNLSKLKKIHQRKSKRVGRGSSSGKGKTAGRGTKGQKARAGYNIPRRFEGGQMALIQRLPKKKGFKSRVEKPQIIKYSQLEKNFKEGQRINLKSLFEKKLINKDTDSVRILLDKKIEKKFNFTEVKLAKKILMKAQQEK